MMSMVALSISNASSDQAREAPRVHPVDCMPSLGEWYDTPPWMRLVGDPTAPCWISVPPAVSVVSPTLAFDTPSEFNTSDIPDSVRLDTAGAALEPDADPTGPVSPIRPGIPPML